MDAFMKYQPLFTEAIDNNRIGVCKWIESGTTIDTAIPEISELTNDKEDWKAIIVRFEDDELMSEFESDDRNPFDFKVNEASVDAVKESEIPLIRLVHMLGGVPAPELKFESEQIFEENKAPRVVYKPIRNTEQEEAHKRLCRKYKYDGKLPSSIVLISVRKDYVEQNEIETAWSSHRESNSSDFWKRNKYPSNCRFLVYDFNKQGPTQRSADEFGFWFSTLLLSTNEMDSGTLQAYKLYKTKMHFDRALMSDSFQKVINRLCSAREAIEYDIKRDIELRLLAESTIPEYEIEIPVNIKLPRDSECVVNTKNFGLFSNGIHSDIATWNDSKRAAEKIIEDSVRTAERSLDQTAYKMRSRCTYSEDEVSGLGRYQVEDLTRETNKIYNRIVEIQGKLPSEDITEDPKITEISKEIRHYLKGRVKGTYALALLGVAVGLIVLCNVPAIINFYANKTGSIGQILLTVMAESLAVAGCGFLALLWQKIKLDSLLQIYNNHIKTLFGKIAGNTGEYAKYLSNIVSHRRGRSYLTIAQKKKYKKDDTYRSKYKHIKEIDLMLAKLREWSVAHHLNTTFNPNITDTIVDTEIFETPEKNTVFTFEVGESYPVPVNKSGETVNSPFSFAKKIEIVREELYDD